MRIFKTHFRHIMGIEHSASLIKELKVIFFKYNGRSKGARMYIIKVLFTFTRKKEAKNKMKEISTEEAVLQ